MSRPDVARRPRRLGTRLDRHGRTMIWLAVVSVLLTIATLIASALGMIGPGKGAGASAGGRAPAYRDAGRPVPERVVDLLSRMSVDDKIGQMIQVDRAALTGPEEVGTYRVGSVVAAGADPAPAIELADRYDAVQRAAQATVLSIPVLYAVDAARGAAIYPHEMGLAASGDADLVRRIGLATAEEVAATGADWTLAPCRCAGTTGQLPELRTAVQGARLDEPTSVLATARYAGPADKEPLRAAIARGAGAVLVPAQQRAAVTPLVKGELRFGGFVATDRAGVDAVDGKAGVTGAEIAELINAGVDMVAATGDYRAFVDLFRAEVQAGRISTGRLDDANHRILAKKFELGLFERPLADRGIAAAVRDQAHRDLAREAVRKSQVLLRNAAGALPLAKQGGKIFVAGSAADDLTRQGAGGGSGTTVLRAIQAALGTGATVTYRRDAAGIDRSYRAAIAVVSGARTIDAADQRALARLRASRVPVIVVLLSDRPVDLGGRLEEWAALVAAWRPGSEGQGVADVLFGDHPPTAKLPAAWSKELPAGSGLSYAGTPTASPTVTPTPRSSPSRRPKAPSATTSGPRPSPSRRTSPTPTPRPPAPSTPAPSPTPTRSAALSCAVEYAVSTQWSTGFVAELRVTPRGAAVDGWTVRFAFPGDQRVTNAWNAAVSQSVAQVTATNLASNARISTGGSVSFGFQATYRGTNAAPPAVTCASS